MGKENIGSNAVEIAISIDPIYPVGVVESFSIDSDVWNPDDVETGDVAKTVDGQTYRWGKNSIKSGTLTLAPGSKLRKFLNMALLAQERNGSVVKEPFSVTMVITHKHNGMVTTYTNGMITSGGIDEQVGSERLADRSYTFKFGDVVKIDMA